MNNPKYTPYPLHLGGHKAQSQNDSMVLEQLLERQNKTERKAKKLKFQDLYSWSFLTSTQNSRCKPSFLVYVLTEY